MKKAIIFPAVVIFCFTTYSQVPQGFNYQAVAHSNTGAPIMNTIIQVKTGILSDTLTPVIVWEELHSTVKTNAFGVFSLVIGTGTRQSGSAATFSDVDWGNTPLYIRTQINTSGSWKNLGSARLWSVPYSMMASEIGGSVNKLEVVGEDITSDEALFEVRRKDGETMFAVYNHGVRVYMPLDTLSKAKKGGFAVGGFDVVKGTVQDYLVVNADSIRAYIDTNPVKPAKGGFSVGGFGTGKAEGEEYLRVTRDSTRINVKNLGKAPKGGFSVGGFDDSKGTVENFLNLTPQNYFIGHRAGLNNTTGKNNSVIGYESALTNTEGSDNVFLGYKSGYSNRLGLSNVFIGTESGFSNTGQIQTDPFYLAYGSYNVFIGNQAGYRNVSGWTNLFLGNSSGYNNVSGTDNTFVGNFSGESNLDGFANVCVGAFSGRANVNGSTNVSIGYYAGNGNTAGSNTFIGAYAGELNLTGSNNTFIGTGAGGHSTGNNNIFIGNNAGFNETGNSRLYIANSGTVNPLIGGDFSSGRVGINRVPSGYATLEVGGNIWANGTAIAVGLSTWSDARYKTDVTPISGALSDILKIQGVKYNWNHSENPDLNFPDGEQIGVIAQEIEKILPQVVYTAPDGYKSVSYEKLVPVLIEAIKEQQKQIESEQKEIDELKTLVNSLLNTGDR